MTEPTEAALQSLDEMLGIDMNNPDDRLARDLVESTFGLVDDLVALRKERGLSQAQVAEALGWKERGVRAFEAISTDPPLSSVRRYAFAVGASLRIEVVKVDNP